MIHSSVQGFFPEGKIISKQIRAESTFCRKDCVQFRLHIVAEPCPIVEAGEWHDVRGGGRLVRDVQEQYSNSLHSGVGRVPPL